MLLEAGERCLLLCSSRKFGEAVACSHKKTENVSSKLVYQRKFLSGNPKVPTYIFELHMIK